MKLRTIPNTLNIRNAVEFLTNIICSDEQNTTVLDTEMGNIAVEIIGMKAHDPHESNFGITVCRLSDAPYSNFSFQLTHSEEGKKIRWYVLIPYVDGQTVDFTRELCIRAMVHVFILEAINDADYYPSVSTDIVDAATQLYRRNFGDNNYHYNQFNRDLCNLSVNPLQRRGAGFRSFLVSNREVIRLRDSMGSFKGFSAWSEFRGKYDPEGIMTFGGSFYQRMFALIVEGLHYSFMNTKPIDLYNLATSRKYGQNKLILPITLMKLCLLDRPLNDEEGDK